LATSALISGILICDFLMVAMAFSFTSGLRFERLFVRAHLASVEYKCI